MGEACTEAALVGQGGDLLELVEGALVVLGARTVDTETIAELLLEQRQAPLEVVAAAPAV